MHTISIGCASRLEIDQLEKDVMKVCDETGKKLSKTMVAVYMRIVACCGGKDHSKIGWGKLSDDIKAHPRTIETLRAKLIKLGMIAVGRGVIWLLDHSVLVRWFIWKGNRRGNHVEESAWKNQPRGSAKAQLFRNSEMDYQTQGGHGGGKNRVPCPGHECRQTDTGSPGAIENSAGLGRGSAVDSGSGLGGLHGVSEELQSYPTYECVNDGVDRQNAAPH